MATRPLPAYRLIASGSSVPMADRQPILDAMNRLLATNWQFEYTHWTLDTNHPFGNDRAIVLFEQDGVIDAFSVFRRLALASTPTVYIESAVIDRTRPVRGVLKVVLNDVLCTEFGHLDPTQEIYLSWRTRSPVAYAHAAAKCDFIRPAIGSHVRGRDDLLTIGKQIAGTLFPGQPLEEQSMIMRGTYRRQKYHEEPKFPLSPEINKWFADHLGNYEDALLCVGATHNRWTSRAEHRS